jgi:hypothetical protein
MHRIIASHLKSFATSNGLDSLPEDDQFEKFTNYSVLSSKTGVPFDLDDVSTAPGEDGIDGIAILVNEEVTVSAQDCEKLFKGDRKNHDVEIVFIQAKSGESFDLGEFLKFKEAILRFLEQDKYAPADETLLEAHKVFEVILKHVPKIRNGRPSVFIRYVTTGLYKTPPALEAARHELKERISELGVVDEIDAKFVDREELTRLWVATYSGTSAQMDMFSVAPMPKIDGVEEAYLGIVRAKEIVDKLLKGEDGGIRAQVFEENVRSFLGADNPVNDSIAATIKSGAASSRFPALNNGITIVSPDVRLQGSTIHLQNFQIVNGCQTSHVLWENRGSLDESVMVSVKVVETDNEDLFGELVTATNSQTRVDKNQFYSLRPIIKRVEKYFDSFADGEDGRLYFERRDRQFVGRDIPAIRIFSMHMAAKSVCAMFLQRPELAFKYPKTMYEELGDQMFSDDVKEIVFYASCLALYRIHLLCSNGVIPQDIKRYKWHMLPLIRAIICGGKEIYPVASNKAEKQAEKVAQALKATSGIGTQAIKRASKIVKDGEPTVDRLKRVAIVNEMLGKL